MRVSSDFLVGLVISLRTGAADVAAFRARIEAVVVSGVAGIAKGRVLIGTSSGGTSGQWTLPPMGTYTADDVLAGYVYLYRLVKALVTETPAINLADLTEALEASLEPVYSTRCDFTALER